MKWYRVTFSRMGKRTAPIELPAHDASDAMYCAGVKAGMNEAEEGEVQLVALECIDDPEHAKNLARLRQHAMRGVAELSERIEELSRKKPSKPAGGP